MPLPPKTDQTPAGTSLSRATGEHPPSDQVARPELLAARRIVIKAGTRVLTRDDGRVSQTRLLALVEAAADLRARGREVLLVTSGAVGLGCEALRLDAIPDELGVRQACAAVGQTRLMSLYADGFARLGLLSAQVLLTQADFDDRLRYLNLRSTLVELLRRGVVPVINENDAVATEELAFLGSEGRPVFGDNDRLSALVATKLGVDLLVLLTDVPGVYDRDPRLAADASLLHRADDLGRLLEVSSRPGSKVGRGGMGSKIEAAAVACRGGCHAVIASGLERQALSRVLEGEDEGTWFPARSGLAARHRWIAFAAAPRGRLVLDAGAVDALVGRGASLLASGIQSVEGEFTAGDVVELRRPDGSLLGRGMVHCGAAEARQWCDGQPPAGIRRHHALVHRDHLVLEE